MTCTSSSFSLFSNLDYESFAFKPKARLEASSAPNVRQLLVTSKGSKEPKGLGLVSQKFVNVHLKDPIKLKNR